MKKLILAAVAIVAMVGCAKEVTETPSEDQVKADFSSAAISRVSNNTWEEGDEVGIYEVLAGQELTEENIYGGYGNMYFYVNKEASGTATANFMTDKSNYIYFPLTDEVDFYAYFPYSANAVGDLKFPINVSNQIDPAAIDFLWAKATGYSAENTSVSLPFEYKLARLEISLTRETVGSLVGATITLANQYTTATASLADGSIGDIDGQQLITAYNDTEDSNNPVYSFILLPTAEGEYLGADDVIKIYLAGNDDADDPDYTWYGWDKEGDLVYDDYKFEAGVELNVKLTLNLTEVVSSSIDFSIVGMDTDQDGSELDAY